MKPRLPEGKRGSGRVATVLQVVVRYGLQPAPVRTIDKKV